MVDSVAIGKAIQSQLQRIQPLNTTNKAKGRLVDSPTDIMEQITEENKQEGSDKDIVTP
jgi:hypothetical protein